MISMLITCEFHCYITVLIYIQQIAPWLLQEMKQMTITNKWDDCREAASDRQFAPADLQHIINTFRRSCRMEFSYCEHNIRCDCSLLAARMAQHRCSSLFGKMPTVNRSQLSLIFNIEAICALQHRSFSRDVFWGVLWSWTDAPHRHAVVFE